MATTPTKTGGVIQCCASCRHSLVEVGNTKEVQCRRFPPVLDKQDKAKFPTVSGSALCGEWAPTDGHR